MVLDRKTAIALKNMADQIIDMKKLIDQINKDLPKIIKKEVKEQLKK